MEKGNLRADVNVSVRQPGDKLGTRCEIKNVNSIRFIGQAIEVEARRQIDIIEDGGKIEQETRLFDPGRGETRSMRSQGRGARLPLLPRSRPAAAGADEDYVDEPGEAACRSCPTPRRRASCATTRSPATTPTCWSPSASRADYFEAVATGRDGKARRQLGDQRAVRAPEQGRARRSRRRPSRPTQLGAHRRPHRVGHHLRQDRQGPVRDRVDGGRRPRRDRREARPEAGHRHRRHREGGRRDHRRQSRQGRSRRRPSPRCSAGSSAR